MLRFHVLFACLHLIRISPNGIDFPVMYNETVRVRPLPAWIRVGGKAGVDNGNRGLVVLILQIGKESAKLSHKEHAFIHYGSAGQTDHISHIRGLLKGSSQNI